ncbi:hypothetical protein COL940_013715 [Colletotrichum noveboracense]|nr:hypothetical protein COL940_013715 [Colletotrichum noveboracense]
MVIQELLIQHNSDLIAYIYEEFILKQKDVKAQTTYVHVVLDGLDECDKEKQPNVISLLERMVSKAVTTTSTVCKVLVTSIMPPAISRKLKQKHCISLSGEKEKEALKKAIASYAAQRLVELKSRMDFKVSELKSLELQLATKADVNDGVNIEELAPTYLFDMCMPLIEERSDTTFAFIHISVKE